MNGNLNFSAFKYDEHTPENVLRLEQVRSFKDDFDGSALAIFNPIRANDVFQIEINADMDAMKVLEYLTFDSPELPPVSIIENSVCPADWNSDWEFNSIRGTVSRYAILIQGGKSWLIVGLEIGDDIKLALMDPEDNDYCSTRYKSKRILGELSIHSEGPGPVSWDGNSALIEMDGYWIEANGGDFSGEDLAYELARNKFASTYVNWLVESDALIAFILEHVKCEWTAVEDAARYADLLVDTWDFISFRDELSDAEVELILDKILVSKNKDKELIQILKSPSHHLAQALVVVMDEVVESESPRNFMWQGGFVNHLEKISQVQ